VSDSDRYATCYRGRNGISALPSKVILLLKIYLGNLTIFFASFLHKVTTKMAKIDNLLALVVLLISEIEVGCFFVTWFFPCFSLIVRRWRKITQFRLEVFFWVAVKSSDVNIFRKQFTFIKIKMNKIFCL
jgi:hypothetical protein